MFQEYGSSVNDLAFWMANLSELLNFMRQDQDLCLVSGKETFEAFAASVQQAFRCVKRFCWMFFKRILNTLAASQVRPSRLSDSGCGAGGCFYFHI